MTFAVGDKVVYPHHGAAIIEGKEKRVFDGQKTDYFVLRITYGDLKVSIPVDKADEIGLREVINDEEVEEVFAVLRKKEARMPTNWSRRFKNHVEKLKSGDIVAPDGSKWTGSTPSLMARSQLTRIPELRALADRYAALTKVPELAAEAHLRAGLVEFRLARREEALAHFGEVFRNTRDPYFTHLAYLFIGAVRESRGETADAVADELSTRLTG